MSVQMTLNGNDSGEGFLIAPLDGNTFKALIKLQSDTGPTSVSLRASPDTAGLEFSQSDLEVTDSPTVIEVHATRQSNARNDTTIEVVQDDSVVASVMVTSIANPIVHFRGRFQARFATQPAFYNQNPRYTHPNVNPDTAELFGPGWTWILEGEPNFVPETNNVPERLEMPVGREIRFNNPVALRSHAEPVVTTVDAIEGQTTTSSERFVVGDIVIGKPVDVGPHTYFAGNRNINPAEPRPEEFWLDTREPLGLFEIHIGSLFSGASQVGPFVGKADPITGLSQHTREPDSRPIADGLEDARADLAEFGLPTLQEFSDTRMDALVAHYNNLPDVDTIDGRNLARRIGHLLGRVSSGKRRQIEESHPGEFTERAPTLRLGWDNKQVFDGKVDTNLNFQPGQSAVIQYFQHHEVFRFEDHMFAFHSDELCAHHRGSIRVES